MSRIKINFILDSIAFVLFLLLAATGILIHYMLPAGSGHFLMIWNMNRHEWGQIHFWIAIALLATMCLHIVLHWRWIVSTIKGKNQAVSGYRLKLGLIGIIILTALTISPFFAKIENTGRSNYRMRSKLQNTPQVHSIRGSMTLQEVERVTGVSFQIILKELNLPNQTSGYERLGSLRKLYGFEIEEVRDIIEKYKAKTNYGNNE